MPPLTLNCYDRMKPDTRSEAVDTPFVSEALTVTAISLSDQRHPDRVLYGCQHTVDWLNYFQCTLEIHTSHRSPPCSDYQIPIETNGQQRNKKGFRGTTFPAACMIYGFRPMYLQRCGYAAIFRSKGRNALRM